MISRVLICTAILLALSLNAPSAQSAETPSLETLNGRIKNQSRTLSDLKQKLEDLAAEIEELKPDAEKAQLAIDKKAALTEEKRQYLLDLPNLEEELFTLAEIRSAYEEQFRPKLSVRIGHIFNSVIGEDGNTYLNAQIVEINDKVKVNHPNGYAYVDIRKLPDEIVNSSILAPRISVPVEYTVKEVKKKRPIDSVGYELRSQFEREALEMRRKEEETELAAKLELMERQRNKRRETERKIDLQVDKIRSQISALRDKRSALDDLKYKKQIEYRDSKVKPDRKKYEETLDEIDQSISGVNSQIRALDLQISKLRKSN